MIRIALPEEISLTCPACKARFTLASHLLDQRPAVACPLCVTGFAVIDGLDSNLRLRIYHSVRSHIEGRVYEQQQLEHENYFEDRPNL